MVDSQVLQTLAHLHVRRQLSTCKRGLSSSKAKPSPIARDLKFRLRSRGAASFLAVDCKCPF